MKLYSYLLFKIYSYYHNNGKEDSKMAIFSTLVSSTVIIFMFAYTSLCYFDLYIYPLQKIIIPNSYFVLIYLIFFSVLNYFFFIKAKLFLKLNFINDKKGSFVIIGFIILLFLMFLFIANKNRDKIFKERENARIESRTPLARICHTNVSAVLQTVLTNKVK